MAKTLEARQTVEMAPKRRDEAVWDAFRRWGYFEANLDPLGFMLPLEHPELRLEGESAEEARRIYCGSIGAEFMHIPDPERRRWVSERLEAVPAELDRERILERLVRADLFEQVMQMRYLGTKRFSLEGITGLIPLLDEIFTAAIELGAVEAVIAMSHRGRLNVMAHIVGQASRADIFARFEDVDPRSVLGGGDVKYHVGATGDFHSPRAKAQVEDAPGFESEPPGSGGSGGDGAHAGKADAPRRARPPASAADDHARRRGLRGTGRMGRDAEYGRRCRATTLADRCTSS